MTTKQELIDGMEYVIQEARRIGTSLSENDWSKVVDQDGWKSKEVLAHIAGVSTIVVPFVQGMANAQPGTDTGSGVNIDQLNAGLVGARASKSVPELVDEIEKGYKGAIDFVKSQPDDFWMQKRTFLGYKDVPLADLGNRMVVLHGLSHIYSAYTAVAFG